jgi:hypothetical protein
MTPLLGVSIVFLVVVAFSLMFARPYVAPNTRGNPPGSGTDATRLRREKRGQRRKAKRAVVFGLLLAGCSGAQHPQVRAAVAVTKDFAKAVCRAVESPAAAALAEIDVTGVGTLAVTVARLVCLAFTDDPRALVVRVESDGTVTTVDGP